MPIVDTLIESDDISSIAATPIEQEVVADEGNSSTSNLSGSGTFTGISHTTLGVAGIQVSLKTDQNCIVYVDQSPDGTNWDIVDHYDYHFSQGGNGWTVQAINSYYRVRVTNQSSSSTTYFRLQTALCPIVEAIPRSLSDTGNLKVSVQEFIGKELGEAVNVSPMGELMVAEHTRLVGAAYASNILDPNFWITPTKIGSAGVAVASGYCQLYTSITANSSVVLNSNRVARYVGSYPNYYRGILNVPAASGINIRRWGAFDNLDGYFYEHDGSTLSVVSRKNGVDTKVSSGSFNGNVGNTYAVDTGPHTYEIYWTNTAARYAVDEELIHKTTGTTAPLTYTQHLRVGAECTNSGGNTYNNTLNIRTHTINRMGNMRTNAHSYHVAASETRILKYGPGELHRIVCNGTGSAGNTLTIYDGIGTVGYPIMAVVDLNKANLATLEYGAPFSSGLLYVTNSTTDVTIVYE